jgi:hypothetical protein
MSNLYDHDLDQLVLIFFSDPSGRHSTSTAFHAFRPHRLEPRILQDVSREAFVRTFARQLQPHSFWFYTACNAPTIYQPNPQRRLGARLQPSSRLLQPSQSFRTFPQTHKLERYIPPLPPVTLSPCYLSSHGRSYLLHRRCGESTGRQRFPRSHSRYCPVFHLHRCDSAVRNHALRSDVWRPDREQVTQVPRLSLSHTRALLSPRSLAHSLALALAPSSHPPLSPLTRPRPRTLLSPCSLAHSLAPSPSSLPACHEKLFGDSLCRNHAIFTLTIMFIMDLVLFFLDTFLWYIIRNTVYSIARSFMLGLSIWTPWRDIYARLPKRIYSKILATSDL